MKLLIHHVLPPLITEDGGLTMINLISCNDEVEQPNPALHKLWAISPTSVTALPTSTSDTLSHRTLMNCLELSLRKTAENSQ